MQEWLLRWPITSTRGCAWQDGAGRHLRRGGRPPETFRPAKCADARTDAPAVMAPSGCLRCPDRRAALGPDAAYSAARNRAAPLFGKGIEIVPVPVQHLGLVLAMFGALVAERGQHLSSLGAGIWRQFPIHCCARRPQVFAQASAAVLCGHVD